MIKREKVKAILPVLAFAFFFSGIPGLFAQPFACAEDSTSSLSNWFFNLNKDQGGKETMRQEIARVARRYLGIRYRSSGKNPGAGFDCSGFTGYVFKKLGIPLKASSPAQAKEGRKIPFPQARKGDLAFFGHKGRKGKYFVNHAAIVISEPGEPLAIIHSASRKGIVITRVNEDPYWKKSLLFVKSVL